MPKWRINTPYPGAYVEGIGILKPGTEIELPEKHIVRRLKDGKPQRVRVWIKPRATWEPVDDAAKVMFEEMRASMKDKERAVFDKKHEFHKNPDQHEGEEVVDDLIEKGVEQEEVDEDETVDEAGGDTEGKPSKKKKRASDAP